LLAHLRTAGGAPGLTYAETPVPVSGGFETAIYRFRLADPPPALTGPLILRLLRPFSDPVRVRLEAAVQNALADLGYAAPRVAVVEPDPSVLGGAFMVMACIQGRPLGQGIDGLVAGGGIAGTLRLVADAPRTLERMVRLWADSQAALNALPAAPVLAAIEAAGLKRDMVTVDGRLAGLGRAIDRLGLTGLQPGHDWLVAHRPPAPAVLSVCHGDFHPLNILADGDRVAGVIDWGNVMVGDAALDVASTVANLATVPIGAPALVRPLARGLVRYALWRYRRAYARRRALDEGAVRYYQVFRCFAHLVSAARDAGQAGPAAGAHQLPAARQRLIAHIRALSGIELRVAADGTGTAS
jgi:aminoglycoside phosphotransferase (APT) family kinase protein